MLTFLTCIGFELNDNFGVLNVGCYTKINTKGKTYQEIGCILGLIMFPAR